MNGAFVYRPFTGRTNVSAAKVTQTFHPVVRYSDFKVLMMSMFMVFLDIISLLAQNQAVYLSVFLTVSE